MISQNTVRDTIKRSVFIVVITALMACGQKGALYLPSEESKTQTPSPQANQTEDSQGDDSPNTESNSDSNSGSNSDSNTEDSNKTAVQLDKSPKAK